MIDIGRPPRPQAGEHPLRGGGGRPVRPRQPDQGSRAPRGEGAGGSHTHAANPRCTAPAALTAAGRLSILRRGREAGHCPPRAREEASLTSPRPTCPQVADFGLARVVSGATRRDERRLAPVPGHVRDASLPRRRLDRHEDGLRDAGVRGARDSEEQGLRFGQGARGGRGGGAGAGGGGGGGRGGNRVYRREDLRPLRWTSGRRA